MNLKTGFAALALATASLLGMSDAEAKRIGYTTNCWNGNPSTLITQAGHTPVALNTSYVNLTAAALVGLDGLFSSDCHGASNVNVNVDQAVANGLIVWYDDYYGYSYGATLPGNRSVPREYGNYGVQLPAGAPWTTGPGGTASPAGLDAAPSYTGYAMSSLPADTLVMATDQSGTQARVISYTVGQGRVVVSTYATSCMLPGGACTTDGYWPSTGFIPAVTALTVNLFAWAEPAFTSCADEGFTGSKLSLCQKICEVPQSPATLTNLIRLYTATYRQAPPCGI